MDCQKTVKYFHIIEMLKYLLEQEKITEDECKRVRRYSAELLGLGAEYIR